jgi:hypothetical protein
MTENEASQLGHDEGKIVMTDPDRKMKDTETFCGGCEIDDISPGHYIPIDIAADGELHNAFCCGVIYEIKNHYRDQAWRIREEILNRAPYGTNPDELNKQLLLELAADEIPRVILDEIAAYDAEETGYDEDEEEDNTVSLYFDGGGSVYVRHAAFCHVYEDGRHAAHDVRLLLAGANTSTWDNNEIDGWEAILEANHISDLKWYVLPEDLATMPAGGRCEEAFLVEMGLTAGEDNDTAREECSSTNQPHPETIR